MYPVSERYKTAVKEQLKTSEIYGTIETRSGKKYKFDMNNIIDSQISLEESVAGAEITIGYVSASEFNIAIRGFHDDVYGLMGAVILPYYRLWFNETEFEDVPLGVFNVTEPTRRKENVYIVALDNMIRLDKGIEGVMASGRPQNIIESLCNRCGVTLASSTADFAEFANYNMGFALEKDHNVTTCRDLLAWLCQATATVARCNRFGEIELLSVTNREIVEVFDVDHRFSESVSDGLSRITGVSMKIGEKSYFTGTDDYILELEENPTLRYMTTEAQRKTFFRNILNQVSTIQYVPSEVEVVNNPALQAGDFVGLQLDTAGMNLLQNSGFKDNTNGWTLNPGVIRDPSVIYNGCVSIKSEQVGHTTDRWRGLTSGRHPASQGELYTASIYTMWQDASTFDNSITLELSVFDDSGTRFATYAGSATPTTALNGKWQRIVVTSPPLPANTHTVGILAFVRRNGTAWFTCPMLTVGEEEMEYGKTINELYPNATSDGIIKSYITNHFWKYRGKHELESAGRSDLLRGNYSQASKSIASVQADSSQALADSLTALDLADNAMASANEKSTVFHSPTPPAIAGRKVGDTWFNTAEGAIYEFDEGDWVKFSVDKAGLSSEIQDEINSAMTKADEAFDEAGKALTDAQTAMDNAETAQTTADGKNKIVRETTSPKNGNYNLGDIWYQYSSGNIIIGFWVHNGTGWVAQSFTDTVIANLDAGKITTGYLSADRLNANSITTEKIEAGAITAESAILAAASVLTANIKDLSVTNAKIANLAINAAKIADLAVTTAKIADAAITNAKIANLDAGKITAGTIDVERLRLENFETQSGKTKIDNEGRLVTENIKAINGDFSGKATFNKGDIAGWVLDSTGFYSPTPSGRGYLSDVTTKDITVAYSDNGVFASYASILPNRLELQIAKDEYIGSGSIRMADPSVFGGMSFQLHDGFADATFKFNRDIEIKNSLVLTENTFFNTASTPTSNHISANEDLNDYTSIGIYWSSSGADISATLKNCPHTNTAFRLEVIQTAGNYIIQRLTQAGTGTRPIEWVRQYRNGTWGNWQNTQPVVGTYTGNGVMGRLITHAQVFSGAFMLVTGVFVNDIYHNPVGASGRFTVGGDINKSGVAYTYYVWNT